jgi:Caspase domain
MLSSLGRWSFVICILLSGSFCALAEKRTAVALVIGNSQYVNPSLELKNPANDASDIANALKTLDIDVDLRLDLKRDDFLRALADLARRAERADVVLFYFAGHGVQYQGRNYLLPIDSVPRDNKDIQFQTTKMEDVLAALDSAPPSSVKIVILDACRNTVRDPNKPKGRSISGIGDASGLARIDSTDGMIVFFSTSPGMEARDGQGRNSPFAAALAKRIVEPHVEIQQLFSEVSGDVKAETEGAQHPETVSSELTEPFFLNPGENDAVAWDRIHMSRDPAVFLDFMRKFPNSPRKADAQDKLDLLDRIRRDNEAEKEEEHRKSVQAANDALLVKLEAARKEQEDARLEDRLHLARERAAQQATAEFLLAQRAEAERIRVAQIEAERQAAAGRERLAQIEAERQAAAQREQLARIEAETKAAAEKARIAQEEAEKQAAAERERLARVEAEKQAAAEKARIAQEEAERQAAAERDRLARVEAEKQAAAEKTRIAQEEAERQAEAERAKLERAEAEKQARDKRLEEQLVAERARLAEEEAQKRENERLAAEQAAREAAEKRRVAQQWMVTGALEERAKRRLDEQAEERRIIEACGNDQRVLAQLAASKQTDAIDALAKDSICPTIAVAAQSAKSEIAMAEAKLCEADKKLVDAVDQKNEDALRGVLIKVSCEQVQADVAARLATMEDEKDRMAQECLTERSHLLSIDLFSSQARRQLTSARANLTCSSLRDQVNAAIRAVDDQAALAQVELIRLGCYTGPPSGKLDDATIAALTNYLTARHATAPEAPRLTDSLIDELHDQHYEICAPAGARPVARVATEPQEKPRATHELSSVNSRREAIPRSSGGPVGATAD